MPKSFRIRLGAGALVALVVAMGMLMASDASAAATTVTSNITYAGTSPTQSHGGALLHCDVCAPDVLFSCGGCAVTAGVRVTLNNSVGWTAPATIDTTYDTDQLHQGATVDLSNTLTPGAGTITINYDIPVAVGLFVKGGDFPPDWTPTSNYTYTDTIHLATSTSCTPPLTGADAVCTKTDTIDIASVSFLGVEVGAKLVITHEFTVSGGDITSHRIVSVTGVPDSDLTFVHPVPSVVADPFDIPCAAPVGTTVGYSLTNNQYSPSSVVVTGTAGIKLYIDSLFGSVDETFDILSGTVFDTGVAGGLVMSGGPDPSFNLGTVLADNVPPEIAAVIQGGTFVEGSDVAFVSVATDNCTSAADLAEGWQFSDGGVAFGSPAYHAFADNSDAYTGLLTVTDLAGNSALHDFDVQDIANANPIVTPPPDVMALWGVPIDFHADAVDPGSADQPTLQFHWDFDDGSSADGADVTHAYALPGAYAVDVTVADKDGGVGAAGLTATIAKRGTTLVYTGALQALPRKYATLSATLSDELGEPVVGRTVEFTLGSQTVSGVTDATGSASVALRLKQVPGTYDVTVDFAGDALYVGDSDGPLDFLVGNEKGGPGGGPKCGTPPCGKS